MLWVCVYVLFIFVRALAKGQTAGPVLMNNIFYDVCFCEYCIPLWVRTTLFRESKSPKTA